MRMTPATPTPCGADDRATASSRRESSSGGPAPPVATTTMRVMVRTLRGDRVALDVDGAATVAQLKAMVMAREGVAVGAQRLFFAGRHLDDDGLPVAHYGVCHGSVSSSASASAPTTPRSHSTCSLLVSVHTRFTLA